MDVSVGQQYRLREVVGDHPGVDLTTPLEQFENRHHPLDAGWIGTVLAVVPAEVDGAGTYDEDHVVMSFDDPDRGSRNVSFTEAQLADLFEEV